MDANPYESPSTESKSSQGRLTLVLMVVLLILLLVATFAVFGYLVELKTAINKP